MRSLASNLEELWLWVDKPSNKSGCFSFTPIFRAAAANLLLKSPTGCYVVSIEADAGFCVVFALKWLLRALSIPVIASLYQLELGDAAHASGLTMQSR